MPTMYWVDYGKRWYKPWTWFRKKPKWTSEQSDKWATSPKSGDKDTNE